MIRAAGTFIKNDHKPASIHANYFHRHTTVLFDELHLLHLEEENEGCLAFALFSSNRIQRTKVVFDSIMSLFIRLMCDYDYNSNESQVGGRQTLRFRRAAPAEG